MPTSKDTKKKNSRNNIFENSKRDAGIYLFVYVILPIFAIVFTIAKKSNNNLLAYSFCYLSIMINAFECLYDITNRWSREKSIKNAKLFWMAIPVIIIIIYSLSQFIGTLMMEKVLFNFDWIFISYSITIFIALFDGIRCFSRDITLSNNA